ncbi:MAG: hypothetical protein IT207_10765 [Fimbriimonadaceae bacterium]|nr:hypothetical protein [Fimbriimonadaceae bacterium]
MSRYRRLLGAVGAVLLGFGAWQGYLVGKKALGADPMAEFRAEADPDAPAVEMRVNQWQAHDGDRLVATAKVAKISSDASRDTVTLSRVRDGVYRTKEGRAFGFDAQSVVYYSEQGALTGSGGARVHTADFDVNTPTFRFEPKESWLRSDGPIRGTLLKGSVKASRLAYFPQDGTLRLTGLLWQGQPPQQKGRTNWRFTTSPESVTTIKGPVSKFTKVTATDGEVTVKADTAEYNRETDVLLATGNVTYYGKELNATARKATVFRKERRVLLQGTVDLLVKPRAKRGIEVVEVPPVTPLVPENLSAGRPRPEQAPEKANPLRESQSLREYPMAITAETVEYWYSEGSRRAVLSGAPQARQSLGPDAWRVIWANKAQYDLEAERIKLTGTPDRKVRMVNSLGDDYVATWVDASTKEGDDDLSAAGVEATIVIEDGEVPAESSGSTGGGGSSPSLRGRVGG